MRVRVMSGRGLMLLDKCRAALEVSVTSPSPEPGTNARRSSILAAAMIGVGLMAAIDEIVFHQILAWHHFYDQSTSAVALMSDGLLHAGELVLIVGGFHLAPKVRPPRDRRLVSYLAPV
ncbi:DUF2243 domain-containing protein [Georgenia muralis]|uniref:DUF2243 domain-containing protein n=1 Tax=Georgenia muralis TaxID=154117 RepID=UPI001FE867D8|nr:DUF2243 domain-containing protein [Georgenia muralis]